MLFSALVFTKDLNAAEKNFMWEVKGENNSVYLLGSIHLAPKSIYPLAKVIESSFDKSDYLVVEADIANPQDQMKLQQMAMNLGVFKEGSIKDNISPAIYSKLEKEVEKVPMLGMAQLEKMKPWMVAITLSSLNMMTMGYNPQDGIDMHFLTKARGKKKILELESSDFQLKMLSGFDKETQEAFLEKTLSEIEDTKTVMKDMFKSWQNGDVKGIEKIAESAEKAGKKMKEMNYILLDKRNFGMAKKIEKYLEDDKDYFVVVGAAHLVGKNGIVKLLKKKGFKSKQL